MKTHFAESIGEFEQLMKHQYYSGDYLSPHMSDESHFRLDIVDAGLLPMTHYLGSPISIRRQWTHIRDLNSRRYVIWFPLMGKLSITQDQVHDELAETGEFVITCGDRPFHIRSTQSGAEACSQMHVIVPESLIKTKLPEVDRLCGRAFPVDGGSARIAADLFSAMFQKGDVISQRTAEKFVVAGLEAIVETVRDFASIMPAPKDIRRAQFERAVDYVERHIDHQGLTGERVAEACNISRRYLHDLFSTEGTTLAEFIWETRLTRARDLLADRHLLTLAISEIARMCGFKSAAHFSHSYKQRFGCSPRDFRRRDLI